MALIYYLLEKSFLNFHYYILKENNRLNYNKNIMALFDNKNQLVMIEYIKLMILLYNFVVHCLNLRLNLPKIKIKQDLI